MKRLVSRLVLAMAIVSLSVPVIAADSVNTKTGDVKKISIELMKKKYTPKDGALVVDGTTYLPMRYIFEEILGYNVKFDSGKGLITVNETKEEFKIDTNTHLNPFDLNTPVNGVVGKKGEETPYTMTISNVIRGKEAYEALEDYIHMSAGTGDYAPKGTQSDKKQKDIDKVRSTLDNELKGPGNPEFLIFTVRLQVGNNGGDKSAVVMSTSSNDFTGVCGDNIKIEGLDKQYNQYKSYKPSIHEDLRYWDRKLYSDGVSEGIMVVKVYSDDKTPRVQNKQGQWFKLY